MTDKERIELFLVNSDLVAQPIEAMRPRFSRWAQREERLVVYIPRRGTYVA